jgi:hypothetical protein
MRHQTALQFPVQPGAGSASAAFGSKDKHHSYIYSVSPAVLQNEPLAT